MDLRNHVDMDVLDNVVETTISLGRGAYGEVKVVKYKDEEHAGKYYHSSLMAERKMHDKCLAECKQAISIKHQNIVKTVGIFYKGPDLVLVMEKLPYCLSKFVSQIERELPEYIKHSILHDVSKGIHFLHSMQIMHRDLTASNILLTETLKAKITDFGQAKFVPYTSFANSGLTPAPGNIVYMPPEALGLVQDRNAHHIDIAEYTFSIDIFSFGVLMLHVYLRELPQPGGWFTPMGELLRQRAPLEYFDKEIQKAIPDIHALHPLLRKCLQLKPANRPKPDELVCTLKKFLDNSKSVFKKLMNDTANYSTVEQELTRTKELLSTMTKDVELHGEENIKLKEQWKNLHERYNIYQRRSRTSSATTQKYAIIENVSPNPNNQSTDGRSVCTPSIRQPPPSTPQRDPSSTVHDIYVETITNTLSKVQQENSVFWEDNKKLREQNKHLQNELEQLLSSGIRDDERMASFDGASIPLLQSLRNHDEPLPPTVACTDEVSISHCKSGTLQGCFFNPICFQKVQTVLHQKAHGLVSVMERFHKNGQNSRDHLFPVMHGQIKELKFKI